jgi:hypothetical protein
VDEQAPEKEGRLADRHLAPAALGQELEKTAGDPDEHRQQDPDADGDDRHEVPIVPQPVS